MDACGFDALARMLAVSRSRRILLSGVAGGILGLAGRGAGAQACREAGRLCNKDANCCSGICDTRNPDPTMRNRCACPSGTVNVRGACGCASLVLAGGPNPSDAIEVDDDLTVYLNGTPILTDNNGLQDFFPPISIPGTLGDQIRVVATDIQGAEWAISPLYLHCPALGTVQVLDAAGFRICCSQPVGGVFYDKTFTIAI